MDVLVFGGTSEGRRLVEWLAMRGSCDIVACTATAYGASLIAQGPRVRTLEGPLTDGQKDRLMEEHDFVCIVDATHPYARHISQSVAALGRRHGVDVVRVIREALPGGDGSWTSVADASEAARLLAGTEGNILLTTGSKDLAAFTELIPGFAERLYVRVLPVVSSLERTHELGIPTSHVIAMQGPFSEQMNRVLIDELDIAHLVTKESGPAGGFDEKVRAARACGIDLVVIERPEDEPGLLLSEAQQLLEDRYGL